MNHKYILAVFVLKNFFTLKSHPIEIIGLIIQAAFDPLTLCAGYNFTIKSVGSKIYSVGNGIYGQLGLSDFTCKLSWCQIK